MRNVFNLFNGNIYELVEALQAIPEKGKKEYLKFANQPTDKIAERRLLEGDSNLFKKYQALAATVKVDGYNAKEYTFDNEGLFFDTATFLTGQPEYWINEVDTTTPAPAKDIKINIAAPFWVKESDIFAKLIQIVKFIDAAEATGQRLAIKAVVHSKGDGQPFTFEVEIKKESEPINIQQLVYLLANPILLRYALLCLQDASKNTRIHYNPYSDLLQEADEIKQTDYLYIPSISYDKANDICYTGNKSFNYGKLDIAKHYNIKF